MRIACIYLPSLPLQVHLRGAPAQIGAPVAVVASPRAGALAALVSSPVVVARSRAAAAAGVRLGISALIAREAAPGLVVTAGDRAAEDAALRAVADALGAVTDGVDLGGAIGGQHAIYAAVPPRVRGTTFGARVLAVLEAQGLRARVGIADDRFTAWVAASFQASADEDGVVSVPRGGSAAFLAPLPLALLAISPEVQHVLGALGVRTLGEFAALPPPSTMHPWDADYQQLARGEGAAQLTPYRATGGITERVACGGEVGVAAALGLAVRRLAGRLAGRGQAAASIYVRTGAGEREVPLIAPLSDERDLGDRIGRAIHDVGAVAFIELEVTTLVDATGATAAPAASSGTSVPAEVDPSQSPSVAPFRLTEPHARASALGVPHRRTRRGKQRPRHTVASQSRLFAG